MLRLKSTINILILIILAGTPLGADTITERFRLPDGYVRTEAAPGSFAAYLRKLKLKPAGAPVLYHNGKTKPNEGIYIAVIDLDIGTKDLQQCADAIMRLWAEYHYARGNFKAIHFNFTNGFKADYEHWMNGYRIRFSGNRTEWVKKTSRSSDYKSFRQYLELVFMYAGTLSLAKELKPVNVSDMQIGDIFIRGGSPGHAVLVADMAVNPQTGKKIYLLAQSYMPAQDIQILQNPSDPDLNPWYELKTSLTEIITPEWTFKINELKSFYEKLN